MSLLFRRSKPADLSYASGALAQIARRLFVLEEEAAVSVSELHCGHDACGGVETVILVMRPGRRTEAVKIGKPITAVTEADIAAAADFSSVTV